MEINLVVFSAGNSRLAVGTFVAGELSAVSRIPFGDKANWEEALGEAWNRIEGRDNAAIVGASVNPAMNEAIEQAVSEVADRRVVWVGKDIELPCKVLTEPAEQTGVDRILATAAAYEQLGRGCVLVDAGTAITINFCDDQGDFLGGAIAPGMRMQLASLHAGTAQLPENEMKVPTGAVGRSTEEAMRQGVYHGIRGMVKELVENYATELGRWPEVIATGGDATALFGDWELIHAISPDLVLYGVALAYAEHHIRNET